jgi:hypothetical protein
MKRIPTPEMRTRITPDAYACRERRTGQPVAVTVKLRDLLGGVAQEPVRPGLLPE